MRYELFARHSCGKHAKRGLMQPSRITNVSTVKGTSADVVETTDRWDVLPARLSETYLPIDVYRTVLQFHLCIVFVEWLHNVDLKNTNTRK